MLGRIKWTLISCLNESCLNEYQLLLKKHLSLISQVGRIKNFNLRVCKITLVSFIVMTAMNAKEKEKIYTFFLVITLRSLRS